MYHWCLVVVGGMFSLSITNRFSLQISFIPIASFSCKTFYLLVFFSNLTTNIEIKKMHFTGKLNLPHIKRTKTRKKKKTATGSLWYKNVVWFPWFEWYSSSFVGKINCLARYHYQKAVGIPSADLTPPHVCLFQARTWITNVLWYILHSIMWSERWLIIL